MEGLGGSLSDCSPSMLRRTSMSQRLKDKKARLEDELAQVNSVLAKLEAMPEVAALVDELVRVNC